MVGFVAVFLPDTKWALAEISNAYDKYCHTPHPSLGIESILEESLPTSGLAVVS